MYNLNDNPDFGPWQDPETGSVSFILSERVAPIQQSFYFTNPGVSKDEEWMWFYAAYPPNRQRTLGVVCLDPRNPSIRVFPQAGFTHASPMVTPEGDAAFFCMANSVYRITHTGDVTTVCTVDRGLYHLDPHPQFSPRGSWIVYTSMVRGRVDVALTPVAPLAVSCGAAGAK